MIQGHCVYRALYFYYYHSSSISARGRFVPTGCSHSAPTSPPPVSLGRRQEGHPRAGEEDRDVVTGPADGSVQVAPATACAVAVGTRQAWTESFLPDMQQVPALES